MNVSAIETQKNAAASDSSHQTIPNRDLERTRGAQREELSRIVREVPLKDRQDPAKLGQMIADMQEQIDSMNISVRFSTYGKEHEKISVVVTDKNTDEVIREIPSEELQKLYNKMNELIGVLFDHNA